MMRQSRLVPAAAERIVPADLAVTQAVELALVLLAARAAGPAAADLAVDERLEGVVGPAQAGLLSLVQAPQLLLPARLLGIDRAAQALDLSVRPVHRAEQVADLVEHARRQEAHPELFRRQRRVGRLIGAPARPVRLAERPDAAAAMSTAGALGLARVVDPLVGRQPVVAHHRRAAGPAVAIAEGRLLFLPAALTVGFVAAPRALGERQDVELGDLGAVLLSRIERPQAELRVVFPLLGPGFRVPAGRLRLDIREGRPRAAA